MLIVSLFALRCQASLLPAVPLTEAEITRNARAVAAERRLSGHASGANIVDDSVAAFAASSSTAVAKNGPVGKEKKAKKPARKAGERPPVSSDESEGSIGDSELSDLSDLETSSSSTPAADAATVLALQKEYASLLAANKKSSSIPQMKELKRLAAKISKLELKTVRGKESALKKKLGVRKLSQGQKNQIALHEHHPGASSLLLLCRLLGTALTSILDL